MAQMFCTLKQAADRLETTEAEVEALLADGILREFRDGGNRLVKVSDLAALAAELCPAGADRPARRQAGGACSLQPPVAGRPSDQRRGTDSGSASRGSSAAERITLPLTPAAIARISPPVSRISHESDSAGEVRTARHEVRPSARPGAATAERGFARAEPGRAPHAARKPGTRRRPNNSAAAPTPAFTCQRPRPQCQELSLRQWIWMGLLDDRPHTILALFATLLLAACTITGAVYLLIHAL